MSDPDTAAPQDSRKKTGLLELPRELRDLIYEYLLFEDINTITMLDSFGSSDNDVSARTPTICAVNRQLRAEALPLFYGGNTFTAQLDNVQDLSTTEAWLFAIGNHNIQHLKHLRLVGFTAVPFGHMISRRWVIIALNLKDGTMEIQKKDGTTAVEHSQYPRGLGMSTTEEFRLAFQKLVEVRQQEPWDVGSIKQLITGFNLLCTGY